MKNTLSDLEKYKIARQLILSTEALFVDFDTNIINDIDKCIKELWDDREIFKDIPKEV